MPFLITWATLLQNEATVITNDLSSYLAPVVAQLDGRQGLYSGFIDVKPPGIFLALIPWVYAFGPSIISMTILHALLIFAFYAITIRLFARYLGGFPLVAATLTFAISLLGTKSYSGMLIPTELVANVLVVTILFFTLKNKLPGNRSIFMVGFLTFFA